MKKIILALVIVILYAGFLAGCLSEGSVDIEDISLEERDGDYFAVVYFETDEQFDLIVEYPTADGRSRASQPVVSYGDGVSEVLLLPTAQGGEYEVTAEIDGEVEDSYTKTISSPD